jgi:hypothetical protein
MRLSRDRTRRRSPAQDRGNRLRQAGHPDQRRRLALLRPGRSCQRCCPVCGRRVLSALSPKSPDHRSARLVASSGARVIDRLLELEHGASAEPSRRSLLTRGSVPLADRLGIAGRSGVEMGTRSTLGPPARQSPQCLASGVYPPKDEGGQRRDGGSGGDY